MREHGRRLARNESRDLFETEAFKRWRVRRANNMATLYAVLYGDQWDKYWDTAK